MLLFTHLAGVDFIGVPVTLTLSNVSTFKSVSLFILDDSLTELSETIQLVLSTTTSDLVVADPIPLQIEIIDNDGMRTEKHNLVLIDLISTN